MIGDVEFLYQSRHGRSVLGSFPDGTVVSSNSARCHRARSGETSGLHLSSGKLPSTEARRVLGAMSEGFSHEPVMLTEILEVFGGLGEGVFFDATLGGGGHSIALMGAHRGISLLGLDQDTDALEHTGQRIDSLGMGGRATLRHARFDAIAGVMAKEGIGSLAGALFDLGVSSHQLDASWRGFSYRHEAPLDMRMNRAQSLTAMEVVNTYERARLVALLRDNADERFATRIVEAIIAARPIETTTRLAEVIVAAIPAPARRTGGHPAKRTFQAIRIEVNDELGILESALTSTIAALEPGARLAVLSYHSGEDRIVKEVMRRAETGDCRCPATLPCGCGARATVRRIRAPRTASSEESSMNPRSRSARLRVVEKLPEGGH